MQQIQASLLPFHLHRKTLEVPEGLSLYEITEYLYPRKIPGVDIVINIGDIVIPEKKWKSIKPKTHTLVCINAVASGGGGKKNPLAIILTIAVIIAAPYIATALAPGAAAAAAAGTATFAQTATLGAIKLGVSMVGSLISSMLSSVPKQHRANASPLENSTQFIEGASNKIDRYGVIPVNLGTNRYFPPQAALPYTETSGNKQYVRQIFTYGYGKVRVSERRLGETLLSEYDGVEMNDRLNADLVDGVPLYSNDIFQDGYSVLLSNAAGYIVRTTQRDSDEADIDITFINGLTSFNDNGQRNSKFVDFEVQFALTGTGNWSNGNSNVSIGAQTVNVEFPVNFNPKRGDIKRTGNGVLVINTRTGVVSAVSYYAQTEQPIIPQDSIRIASFKTESVDKQTLEGGGSANILDFIDERSSYIPVSIVSGFAFTYGGTGLTVSVASGVLAAQSWRITDSTAQALRVTQHLKFPTRDQYDIRIKRISSDSVSEQIRDQATLTAIRSIKYAPPIKQNDISGTAMRMLGTDQLNGTVSSYNVILDTYIKDYDADLNMWIDDVITSNPASIYRYVLQSPAFVKRLSDERVNIEKLEEWHIYCELKKLTFNKVIDYTVSIDDLLNDIAAAGMATPHKINGIYSVIIDNERPTIKGMVTPRNSWSYNGTISYPELPHALRVQFRNSNKGYNTDECIVYADGYNETTATLFERLQFDSCTDSDLAWFYGRTYLATAISQPEIHTFNQDFENLTYNRGDKIIFVNDTILVGVGSARIKELIYDGTMTNVTGFIIDDIVNIPNTNQFGVRIRHSDASGFIYYSLTTVIGDTSEFTFATPVLVASAPPLDSLCAFTEFGKELELVVTEIKMNKDHSAHILAINYAPERFDVATGTIPPFNSNVTLSTDLLRPQSPLLAGEIQSDETVMIKNSDGSYISQMIIPLINRNESSVNVIISARQLGASQYFRPNILSSSPEQIIITGLQDGMVYDFKISYQRVIGLELTSQPLFLNNVVYEGASSKPADVQGFEITSSDNTGLFNWVSNTDIDISHYIIRFTRLTSGVVWVNANTVADNITSNRISLPIQSGTYLIKAVDILVNESENATTIISFDNGAFNNVVELLTQEPTWTGTHDNTHIIDDDLYLIDPLLPGYYYFDPDPLDLGDVYESTLSASLIAYGGFYNRLRPIVSTRGVSSIRGIVSNLIRTGGNIRGLNSIRGINSSDWSVTLEYSISNDNIIYSEWASFTASKKIFRYIRLRLVLLSFNQYISPKVTTAEVLVDMPDRYESGENIACDVTNGAIVNYNIGFRNNPAVNITLQNGAVDDRLEFIYKTSAGFQVKVYNATTAGYVVRSLDYNSSGYGRIVV